MAIDREGAAHAIEAFLRALGRDAGQEPELAGTAQRVADMYAEDLVCGYSVNPSDAVRPHVIAGTTGIVALHAIHLTTMCPHHLMPATGLAAVAFAPQTRLVGFGAIVKLLDVLSRRLVLQEQIGDGVVATLAAELDPRWVACRLVLDHTCVVARGERRHGTKVETLAFLGAPSERDSAMTIVRGGS